MRAVPLVLRYGLSNALLLAFIAVLAHGGWPIWAVLVLAALTGGIVDETVGDDGGEINARGQVFVDANLYATLPLLAVMTLLMLRSVASGTVGGVGAPALIAAVLGTGYFYALAGVTVAHELTHRVTNPMALIWARILLAFTLNPTFESYHVLGHHRNVCTYDDAATARRGEYVLTFVARTIINQSIQGWRLEAGRLARKGVGAWTLRNRVLAGIACAAALAAAATLIAGPAGLAAFLAAATWGRILHEMMNYVQHYGIVRAEGAPIEPRHAWDSNRLISNALFYNLPRHAAHHQFAAKPFWALEAPADSPKLPYGYQTMSVISLVPGWWHRTVDPLLADWDRLATDAERALVRQRGWIITMPPSVRDGMTVRDPA
jgi:fatty acid desaturase